VSTLLCSKSLNNSENKLKLHIINSKIIQNSKVWIIKNQTILET